VKTNILEFNKAVFETIEWDGKLTPGQRLKEEIIKNFRTFKAIMRELEREYNCVVIKQSAVDCSVVTRDTRQELFTFSLKEIRQ